MKKIVVGVLCLLMILSGCKSGEEATGITITREKYDELMAAVAENDKLKTDIEYLEQRLDDYQLKEQGDQASTGSTEGTNDSEVAIEEEVKENKLSPSEIEKLNLSPYVGDYGLYGYKDDGGNVIIEPDFDKASTFDNGQAIIVKGGKSGTMDRGGRILWTNTNTYKSMKVEPVNDVVEGSDFESFIKAYKVALEQRDESFIKDHIDENVKISFGGHSGWSGLTSYWSFDEGSEAFYVVMNATLRYGIVDTSGNGTGYTAPYTFANFPSDGDAFTDLICTGSSVNVRTRPTTDSEVITQLSYDVVKGLEEEKDGWYKFALPDGERGYMSATYLKSPLDYRVIFEKQGDKWVVVSFVKGD